jgi:hypothetical protein
MLGWSPDQAARWLAQAGTSPDYSGLFASVKGCTPPTADQIDRVDPATLPEVADVPDLVEHMVEVDRLHDEARRDLADRHTVILLEQALRESARAADPRADDPRWAPLFDASADAARRLADATTPETRAQAADTLKRSCVQCHSALRDHRPTSPSPKR